MEGNSAGDLVGVISRLEGRKRVEQRAKEQATIDERSWVRAPAPVKSRQLEPLLLCVRALPVLQAAEILRVRRGENSTKNCYLTKERRVVDQQMDLSPCFLWPVPKFCLLIATLIYCFRAQ